MNSDFESIARKHPGLIDIERRLLHGPPPTDSMPQASTELNRIARDPAREILGEGSDLDVVMEWYQDLWTTRLAIQSQITCK
ncbi:MAG: hypothetical protein RIC55_21520 [Pirellulaceae bacterium]